MFSLESPRWGDAYTYTQQTFSYNLWKFLWNIPNHLFSWAIGIFSWGLKTEFELATVNEPSVFESLEFYICFYFVVSRTPIFFLGFVNTLLSWKAIIPLSRLTYCAYLVHLVVMDTYFLSKRSLTYLSDLEEVSTVWYEWIHLKDLLPFAK